MSRGKKKKKRLLGSKNDIPIGFQNRWMSEKSDGDDRLRWEGIKEDISPERAKTGDENNEISIPVAHAGYTRGHTK